MPPERRSKPRAGSDPGNIYAEVVLRSCTGASLATKTTPMALDRVGFYQAREDNPLKLKEALEKAGFTVIAVSPFGASITGPQALFQDYFKVAVNERPAQMFFGGGLQHEASHFFIDETPRLPSDVSALAETVYIPKRGYFLAGEGAMPAPAYYHLSPPADISRLTNADPAHARGVRGAGVMVGMVDSGFIANHDYYAGRGYTITVHAAVGSVTVDEYGHGTGIASNLLAIAPACNFHFFKMSDANQWASLAAFRMAVQAGCKVITCSWGQGRDAVLEAEIVAAVAAGVTVIFACGNGGPIGWPGCMPQVISVGGAYPRPDGTWEASTYASSGTHALYPARHCPDLSAIVGQSPAGIFIVMPTMMGAIFDGDFSGGHFPNGDETGPADGWLVASGTSSAAPMVAGAAALLLQARSSLSPAEVKQALMDTCIDVTVGASASGEPAGVGPDNATGAGMINIAAAVDQVSPTLVCPRAPLCARGPLSCPRAPICLRAPLCLRAPVCPRAPICVRAPQICPPSPLICSRVPICSRGFLDPCKAGPIIARCAAGPADPIGPRIPEGDPIRTQPGGPVRGGLVPVTVMVSEDELARWQNDPSAFQVTGEVGMAGEYADFPESTGCERGPFDPSTGR